MAWPLVRASRIHLGHSREPLGRVHGPGHRPVPGRPRPGRRLHGRRDGPRLRATIAGAGAFTTDGAPLVRDWALKVEAAGCTALGYEKSGFTPVFSESFDAGRPARGLVDRAGASAVKWTVASGADPCGQFEGNQTGGAGPYAVVNSNCYSDHGADDDTSLVTPSVNASQLPSVAVQWANDYRDGFDAFGSAADVDVSVDGGTSWTNVWEHAGSDLRGPGNVFAGLRRAPRATKTCEVRFHYTGLLGVVVAGRRRPRRRAALHVRSPAA